MKNITKYGLGTFTYREEPRKAYAVTGTILGGVIGFSFPLIAAAIFVSPVLKVANAYAPTAQLNYPKVALPTDSQSVQIENYIKQVFGKDADKATQVFMCESHLNPKAYNDNTSWGGVGHDEGVAQINDHYQGVTNSDFLYNWKINILMAKQIFDKWGNNFHAWTCGRKLGL